MAHASFFRRSIVVVVLLGTVLAAYLYYNRPTGETISPTKDTTARKSGNSSFHPFGVLLGSSENKPSEGEVLGAETLSATEPSRKETVGLLDRLISTFSDNFRVTPTPVPTLLPSQTPIPTPTSTPVPATLSAGQTAVNIQANNVGTALTTKNYSNLYNLMGVEFRSNFSYEDFVNSLGQTGTVTGFVIQSSPRLFGTVNEWAEVKVQLTQSTGVVKIYNEVFHLENGVWKLYGTEEVN